MGDALNINLSDEAVAESCLQVVRSTIRVLNKEIAGPEGKSEQLCVSFSTNRGKGSGAQVMLVSEFPAFVNGLREAHDGGYETAEIPQAYRPANEVAMSTLSLSGPEDDDGNPTGDNDTVSFRVREGKGSKPAKIPLTEAEDVIAYLESRLPKLEAVIAQVAEAAEAEAADADDADADDADAGDDAGEDAGDDVTDDGTDGEDAGE
jgi:hypothetical protein